MEKKPTIYDDVMNDLEFLTEHEKAYLHMGSEPMKKMLLQRAKMFMFMFRAFKEYNKKEDYFQLLSREEWKKKILTTLHLQFKLKDEQIKSIIDLFWTRVTLPKGGIKRGTTK